MSDWNLTIHHRQDKASTDRKANANKIMTE